MIKWTVWGLAVTLAMVLAMLAVALTTEPVVLALRCECWRPGFRQTIQFDHVQGSLRGPLSLTDISGATHNTGVHGRTTDLRLATLPNHSEGRAHLDSMRVVGVRALLRQDTLETERPATLVDTPRGCCE